MFRRRIFTLANEALFGQPIHQTHPHLIKSKDYIWPHHTADEFRSRRLNLVKHLNSNSIVVIPSYPIKYGSQNIFYPFQQNNNLLYLSGFDEPNSGLVIETVDGRSQSILFCKENDPLAQLWEGPRAGTDRAPSQFGVERALSIDNLDQYVREHLNRGTIVYYDLDSNSSLPSSVRSILESKGSSITSLLHSQRVLKRQSEVTLMKEACKMSSEAFTETMRWSVKSSVSSENSIAAKMDFECRLRGATGLAYVPVVASGPRSLILHYTRNNMMAEKDDLMFMDAGGKFSGYCTDISRAWPLSGRFTDAQREIYSAVLRVQKACIAYCSLHQEEKITLNNLHALSQYLFVEELENLGFEDPEKHIDTLYPHSIGHYLGLDLHDCQQTPCNAQFKSGMVITVEPGLYIPPRPEFPQKYHNIGIRIEDDVVIDEQGITVMTEAAPKEIEQIEQLLN